MRRALERLFRGIVRLVLGVFYREIALLGKGHIPSSGPNIYVGNHGNSLIDAALAIGWLPAGIRFLAKSTLWSEFPAGIFVRLAGAVPVYRRIDEGVDSSKNEETFAACWRILGDSGLLALFPEGVSHAEPRLMPLKTGAARIALGTLQRTPTAPLRIVPFGLIFTDREQFRSRVILEVGAPIDPADYFTSQGETDRDTVRRLTDRIERALRQVTLNYSSWEEAHLVQLAADLYRLDERGGRDASSRLPYQRAFAENYQALREAVPEKVEEAMKQLSLYARLLDLSGLTDRQVATSYRLPLALRFAARSVLDLFLLLPLGALGAALNWLPYKIPAWATRAMPLNRDLVATYKLIISLVVFPLFWALEAYLASRVWGLRAGLAIGLSAPLLGYFAVLLQERIERVVRESRAFLVLRNRPQLSSRLRAQRENALRQLRSLADIHQAADS